MLEQVITTKIVGMRMLPKPPLFLTIGNKATIALENGYFIEANLSKFKEHDLKLNSTVHLYLWNNGSADILIDGTNTFIPGKISNSR
ncbi:MAG: hypothetical protein FWF34_02315 [Alphaproteobacteria bacterium]|nr:hypothetical protein [Alphaproteobacteria bacterium]MCL2890064.1 hypothetical protein [Alphaproteobacteria bacterium]